MFRCRPTSWEVRSSMLTGTERDKRRKCPRFSTPPPSFMTPRFLINFCGVWNLLGAISHFSKHPGSFWRVEGEPQGGGPGSDFHFY